MSRILSGLELDGVLCQMDDVLIYGRDQAKHDARVTAVLKWIKSAGATFNPEKCKFGKTCLKFLGHLIDQNGIHADPDKTTAIVHISPPNDCFRAQAVHGDGESAGQIHTQAHTATARAAQQVQRQVRVVTEPIQLPRPACARQKPVHC